MRAAAVAVLVLVNHTSAADIKETVRLTITGPMLAQPVLVTDTSVLKLSNVYAGAFIGGPASAPPDETSTRYEIAFDIQTASGVKADAYAVTFASSRWTRGAWIYLPGRGDAAYRRNISTIMREAQDGAWHHASDEWADAIRSRLP